MSAKRETIIPEGIEVIAEQAFCGCQIFSVAFPSTLRRIEDNAFCSCASLSKADISKCNNLDHIGDWAFSWCLNLKGSFVLPVNLKTIGANPFANTSIDSIVSLSPKFQTQDGVLLNKDDNRLIVAFFINEKDSKSIGTVMGEPIYGNKNFKVYNIPSYVRIIGDGSFIDAEIEQININSNVEIIGDNPAPNGTKTSFKVENNFRFCIENDMLIDKINGVVLAYFGNNKDLIIPDGVKSFAGASFDMADIDTLIFPETIEEFDEDIFERLDSCPKEIRVPKGTLMIFKSVLPSYNHLLKEIV